MRDKLLTKHRCEVCGARLPEGSERFCPPDTMEREKGDKIVWEFAGCEPLSNEHFDPERFRANRKGVINDRNDEERAMERYGCNVYSLPRNGGSPIRGSWE